MSVLDTLTKQSVLVVGDVMLDQYVQGTVRRISPEAPISVVEEESVSYFPGGAGNVAANLASLGATVYMVGGIGDDHSAERLQLTLERKGVNVSGLVSLGERPTTTKTRVVAHSQQMLRIDRERIEPLDREEEDFVLSAIDDLIKKVGACVLSDYAKGVLTPRVCQKIIEQAQVLKIPTVVDPKGKHFDKYYGATLITPNLDEAKQAISVLNGAADIELRSDQDIETFAVKLVARYGSAMLVTRGAQGMSLLKSDGSVFHIAAEARHVYDVTGAGDTVVALLALGLASGLSLEAAARLGNWAAGIVVSKLGTASVTPEELQQASFGGWDATVKQH
jgi:D-glycero-beta-D-manno-heptose-7-phosphate kinase